LTGKKQQKSEADGAGWLWDVAKLEKSLRAVGLRPARPLE